MKTKASKFFVIDGGEGSGKSTLLKKIAEYYGENVLITREPGGSPYAEEIRELILNSKNAPQANAETMFGLFWAARADHLKNTIIPALEAGKIVISDRFDSSTFAYQIVAQGAKELEDLFWATRKHYLGSNEPFIYLYLDLDPKIGLSRKTKTQSNELNHFDERALVFHQNLRAGFKKFLTYPDIRGYVINAENSPEEVWQEFKSIVRPLI